MKERLDTKIEELKNNDTNMERWVCNDDPLNSLVSMTKIEVVTQSLVGGSGT